MAKVNKTQLKARFREAFFVALRKWILIVAALQAASTPVCAFAYPSQPDAGHNENADTIRGITLSEVTVRRTKEHYSKKNNPAVEFMQRIRNARQATDPRRNPFYNYRKYEAFSIGINDINIDTTGTGGKPHKPGRFDFVREHVDTSAVTGRVVLPLSVKEKVADVIYRKEPHAEKTVVLGMRRTGIDDIADMENIQMMLEETFREVDLYEDNITLLRNRFVSPLSAIAPDFYKFYLTDTVTIADGSRCIVLSFTPRNSATFGFNGRLYVEEGDTTMFVRRVEMGIPAAINVNYVDFMRISQEFRKAPDGSRLKTMDDLYMDLSLIPGTQSVYMQRKTSYANHNFDPSPHAELLDRLGNTFETETARTVGDDFWETERQRQLSGSEQRIGLLVARLRAVPLYRYAEWFIKKITVGYVGTGTPSKFDIGPLNTMISANTVEGLRLRAGGITTANLSPHWFGRGYVAHGFRDHRWKYSAEVEYSFNRKRYHAREFPIHSVMVQHRYDIDQLAQDYMFTNPDNIFLALKRTRNTLITYLRQTSVNYTLELQNHFSLAASANLQQPSPGPFVPFLTPSGNSLSVFNEALFSVSLRFAPGEKFLQDKSSRLVINHDAPTVTLSHTYAPRGFMSSRYTINKTEASYNQRIWFSAFGYLDAIVKGAHQWSRVPFLYLLSPNANLTYTIQPESFALIQPLEYIADTSVSWDLTYWANGAILNYIPFLKKARLREAVAFRGWWGTLSSKNRQTGDLPSDMIMLPPDALAATVGNAPYMEMAVGLDNIFRCLRVDYTWRLNHRHVPGTDRQGFRIAFHMKF